MYHCLRQFFSGNSTPGHWNGKFGGGLLAKKCKVLGLHSLVYYKTFLLYKKFSIKTNLKHLVFRDYYQIIALNGTLEIHLETKLIIIRAPSAPSPQFERPRSTVYIANLQNNAD